MTPLSGSAPVTVFSDVCQLGSVVFLLPARMAAQRQRGLAGLHGPVFACKPVCHACRGRGVPQKVLWASIVVVWAHRTSKQQKEQWG